jgi:hypothetical protein
MKRFFRYFQSTANLCGSVLALAVVAAYFFNLIGPLWWLLAGGAYVAGSLPFAFGGEVKHLPEGLSTADALLMLEDDFLPRLPPKPRKILGQIITHVNDLMPRLKEMEQQGLVEASSRAMLKQTVVRLLPDAVEAYLRLPPGYASHTIVTDGKTAQDLLAEQLTMLQEHIISLEQNLLSADVNSLLANGRFLQEKFQRSLLP